MWGDERADSGRSLSDANRHASDEIRAAGGGRSAAGGRFAQWARARLGGARTDRAVHRSASDAAPFASSRAATTTKRGPDASRLLERALLSDARRCGAEVRIDSADAQRWASATFVGARHAITLSGPSSDAALRWVSALAEAEFDLRGHLVADLAVVRHVRNVDSFHATLEVLTVEER
jgi:hypothetical protein